MKKFLTMLLALVMVLSLAACSSQKGGDVNGGFPASAVDLLTAVWNAYPESEKFSVVGGSLDNPVDNAPGAFPVDVADPHDERQQLYLRRVPCEKQRRRLRCGRRSAPECPEHPVDVRLP